MIYNLAIFEIMEAIEQALRFLLGSLCILVYELIGTFYNLFITISQINVLSGSDLVENLYNKVGLILGIFMVFKLTFSLIQALLDPDKLTDKNNGAPAIIKRSIIAIVLLGITPSIFKEAYSLQSILVGAKDQSDNILYKLIFSQNVSAYNNNFGTQLAADFYFTFFNDNDPPYLDEEIDTEDSSLTASREGDNLAFLKQRVLSTSNGDFWKTYSYLMEKQGGEYVIEFSPLLCLGAGILVLWMILTYCVQIAIRVFQLAYLQLVAPVPILSYISKPDGSFKKWTNQCMTTYLDLFLRLAIIYFVMAMANEVQGVFKNMNGSFLVEVFLIIGLLMFAKKAPDLIKEIFPSMGGAAKFDFGLGSKPLKGLATFGAGAAIGAVSGAATGIRHGGDWKGRITGALGGLGRGALSAKTKGNIISNARKGMANQRVASQKAYEKRNDGSTWWGRNIAPGDAARTKEAFDEELSLYSDYNTVVDGVDKELEKNGIVQAAMAQKQALMERASRGGPAPTPKEISTADEHIKNAKKSALQIEIARGTNGKLMGMLANAEAIRAKGEKNGYAGFTTSSLTSGTAANRTTAFYDNKKQTGTETNEIKGAGGSRNAAYKEAEANAKYYKTK